MLASLQKHGAGFLREERAAIDERPTLELIREQMAKRRDQGQTPRVSVVPRATLPSGARQLLDARWREPLQGIGANARIPGGTLLPEVRLEGMNPLAIIRAQMAIGAAQRRHALQLPQSQQAGRGQPPGEQRAGAGAERFEGGRPPADARAHAAEGDGEAAGTGKRPREEARGSRDARAEHARHFNYDWEEGLLGDEGQKKKYGMCSDPASWQAACTATLAAIPEVTSPEAKKLAEEGGYAIDNPLKLAALLHTTVVKLVQALPVKSVIRAAGTASKSKAGFHFVLQGTPVTACSASSHTSFADGERVRYIRVSVSLPTWGVLLDGGGGTCYVHTSCSVHGMKGGSSADPGVGWHVSLRTPCNSVAHRGRQQIPRRSWSSTERELQRLTDARFSRRVAGRTPSKVQVPLPKILVTPPRRYWRHRHAGAHLSTNSEQILR